MPLTRQDVAEAYMAVLGRPPENEAIIDYTLDRVDEPWGLVRGLLASNEYRDRAESYRGYTQDDVNILKRHAVECESRPGFITDFLGTRTDITFNSHLTNLGGLVEGEPVPANFHAEAVEWIGTLRAVEEAGSEFSVAEIGAGWGPWLVASGSAARRMGKSVYLTGVEADPGHFESMHAHLKNNGLDDVEGAFFLGAIGPVDGFAFFPRIDSALDWGAAAVFQVDGQPPSTDYRGHELTYDKVPAYSLPTVLLGRERFDLLHVDIQGAERDLIPAALAVLKKKVRWIVIGTHSRAIEGELIELLSGDWCLYYEKPCRFTPTPGRIGPRQTTVDGAQVWRNSRI
jgi:FkbM family methyltransferase